MDYHLLQMSKIITLQTLFKYCHGSSSPILGGDLKISDHNNWGGDLSKKLNLRGELNLMGDLKVYEGL